MSSLGNQGEDAASSNSSSNKSVGSNSRPKGSYKVHAYSEGFPKTSTRRSMPPKRTKVSCIDVCWGEVGDTCESQAVLLQSQSTSSLASFVSGNIPANDRDIEAIVRVFPWLSFADASMVLASHRGRVEAAVEFLSKPVPSCVQQHEPAVSMLSLPVEVLEKIFSALPISCLVHLNQTCALLRSTVIAMARKKKHLSIGPKAVACGVLQLYPNVSSLSVRGGALPVLQQLPGTKLASSVTSLTIDGAADPTFIVHDDLLRHLWCLLPLLQSISLRCCKGITQDCFSAVGRTEHDCELLELTVSDCPGITDNALVSAMHRWSNSLVRIRVSGLKHCSDGKTSQFPALLASRCDLPSLSLLAVFGCWKRPTMLVALQVSFQLHFLLKASFVLDDCHLLHNLNILIFVQSITRIEVSGCHSIQQFQCRCEQLQELTLCDNHNLISVNFRSNLLAKLVLSGCSHLSELECSAQTELTELNLYGCRFVPLFVYHFRCSSHISFDCSKLVDASLKPLVCSQALSALNINGCIGLGWLKVESEVLSR